MFLFDQVTKTLYTSDDPGSRVQPHRAGKTIFKIAKDLFAYEGYEELMLLEKVQHFSERALLAVRNQPYTAIPCVKIVKLEGRKLVDYVLDVL